MKLIDRKRWSWLQRAVKVDVKIVFPCQVLDVIPSILYQSHGVLSHTLQINMIEDKQILSLCILLMHYDYNEFIVREL